MSWQAAIFLMNTIYAIADITNRFLQLKENNLFPLTSSFGEIFTCFCVS